MTRRIEIRWEDGQGRHDLTLFPRSESGFTVIQASSAEAAAELYAARLEQRPGAFSYTAHRLDGKLHIGPGDAPSVRNFHLNGMPRQNLRHLRGERDDAGGFAVECYDQNGVLTSAQSWSGGVAVRRLSSRQWREEMLASVAREISAPAMTAVTGLFATRRAAASGPC